MELILYYIKEAQDLLVFFLIFMFVTGVLAYLSIKNFNQNSKVKIFVYGLFLKIKSIDVFQLSIITVKLFILIYATIQMEQIQIWISLIMIGILTLVYIICGYKRIIYEICTNLAMSVMIYFSYIVNIYEFDLKYNYIKMMIRIPLIIFILMLSTASYLKNIDIITENRVKQQIKKREKKENLMLQGENENETI